MSKPPAARLRFAIKGDEAVLYCEIKQGGRFRPIAKRYSGKAGLNIEPGYVVRGTEPGGDYNTISIEYIPTNAQPQ
jgi:hypothetical protein